MYLGIQSKRTAISTEIDIDSMKHKGKETVESNSQARKHKDLIIIITAKEQVIIAMSSIIIIDYKQKGHLWDRIWFRKYPAKLSDLSYLLYILPTTPHNNLSSVPYILILSIIMYEDLPTICQSTLFQLELISRFQFPI